MEILQAIWKALTTENETLITIISIPMTLLEATVTTALFTTVLNIKSDKKQKLLYIIIFSVIALITIYFIPTPYNTIINIIACPILVYFIFKTSIIKSIMAEIVPYIVFVIISSLLIAILVKITNLPSDNFIHIPLYKLCFSLIMYLFVYLICIAFRKFNFNMPVIDKMKKGHNSTIYLNLIIRNYYNCNSILYFYNLYK